MFTKEARIGFAIGTIPGLAIAYFMFNNIGWYHDMFMWQWSHPWVFIPAAAVGAMLAIHTD